MLYSKYQLDDTIVALATAPGVGAIGVIRLSGPQALDIASCVFKGKNLRQQLSHTAHFGTIRNDQGRILDEVLATVFVAPKSYTKENTVELSCHGSPFILQEIIQLLIEKGARLAQPGEFTLRAFLNGQLDLSQAEAVADLIASSSASAHQMAMQQMRGGFSSEIQKLRQELIHFASLIELELDFSEEDVEFADRSALKDLIYRIQRVIKQLLDSFALGNVLKNGVATVIAGRPNAGKSTLLNALLNDDRAIVSAIAGTTRDTIEEVLTINGIQFRLVDTAGIREATDTIEAIGVEKTLAKVQEAAILVYLFDIVDTTLAEVYADLAALSKPNVPFLVVCNKMDQNPYFQPDWLLDIQNPNIPKHIKGDPSVSALLTLDKAQIIPISAQNHQNIEWLKENLVRLVLTKEVATDSPIVSNARHYEALKGSYDSLSAVVEGLSTGITTDFVAMDIRRALAYLGEITGDISTDDLLDTIFSKFCIGK